MSAAAAPPLPGPEEPNVCVSGAEEPICAPQRKCKRVAAGAHSPALCTQSPLSCICAQSLDQQSTATRALYHGARA